MRTHTLALALVLCSRLSTMPECDDDGAAASWVGFLETVESDMIVDWIGRNKIADGVTIGSTEDLNVFDIKYEYYERAAVAEVLYTFALIVSASHIPGSINRFEAPSISYLGRGHCVTAPGLSTPDTVLIASLNYHRFFSRAVSCSRWYSWSEQKLVRLPYERKPSS